MITSLHIHAISARATRGLLQAGGRLIPCALGSSGQRWRKREGDGATPCGILRIRSVLFRPGTSRRMPFPGRAIKVDDGWCDTAADRNYNRHVSLPYPASHEELWRPDSLYDVVAILDYNICPRRRGLGSAVFFHIAEDLTKPTAGCVAIRKADMLRLLELCSRDCRLVILPPGDARRKWRSRPVPALRRT